MTKQEALFSYCLRLGDNSLILGHRLSEWSSKAPIIEEDLALTNMALDLIGRSVAILKYAAEVEGKGHTEDDLAYRRPERKFYNNLLVEQPNGDFAVTIVRQFFNSTFEYLLYEELMKSKDETLAGIAAKTIKEIKYHLRHATDWMLRLGDGTPESHLRAQKALNDMWMFTDELFEMNEVDEILIKEGITVDLNMLKANWSKKINEVILESTLTVPTSTFMQTGSRQGIHSEYLGYIIAEMQYLQRAYPNAKW